VVTIVVSRGWAQRGKVAFEAPAGRLPDVLRRLAEDDPDYERRLLDSNGELYGYLSIFVDPEQVPRHLHATFDVREGSTVTILPPLAGG